VNIQTVQFPHILETRDLAALNDFLSSTAFVISHKSESIDTLLRVLWYIPVNSTIIIVTNCQENKREDLADALKTRLADHRRTYLIHQKDLHIAHLFKATGVPQILGKDGKVRNGKGEGMYIGALAAHLLSYLRWVIFYDADNFVPSALLEYTFAMCRLFTGVPQPTPFNNLYDSLVTQSSYPALANASPHSASQNDKGDYYTHRQNTPDLHNVRICWSSKPDMKNLNLETRVLGRTSKVVSPLFDDLLEGWFGTQSDPISSSNAGEQGMTLKTATTLRFSSGFSIETFQLIDLLSRAAVRQDKSGEVVFQQYLSKSPHFHEKKGDRHIKKMIEESLGCFYYFENALPDKLKIHLQQVYDELHLKRIEPIVYPPLQDLPLEHVSVSMDTYAIFPVTVEFPGDALLNQPGMEVDSPTLLTSDLTYPQLLLTDVAEPDLLLVDASSQNLLTIDVPSPDLLLADINHQDVLANDFLIAD